jgi:phage/plasmid-like protein (TIGR03299 family)
MAHEITARKDGTSEMAFTGPRGAVWHGLGQQMDDNATFEQWKVNAGLDWEVHESTVDYTSVDATSGKTVGHTIPDKRVLFRSDSKDHLGIVSNDFKIVQPNQVIEFFRDLVELHGFKLSTAGSLFGGRRFWALADVGKSENVVDTDRIDGHLLLTTAVDGTMSTQARFTSTRVVCNNTLTIALAGNSSRPVIRVTHKKDFDPSQVKIDLKLIDKGWADFMVNMKKLANKKMSARQTREFFEEQLFDTDRRADEQTWGITREVTRLTDLALGGSGSGYSKGTAYGTLCAITEHYTHGTGKRDASRQFWDAYVGHGDSKKQDMYRSLLQNIA